MPFSMADMCVDPDLADCITIIRSSGSFSAGIWQNTTTNVSGCGVITIADDEALAQVPEGDRVTGSLQLLIGQPVYETLQSRGTGDSLGSGLSDQISWNGNNYRVQKVAWWAKYCMWLAILVRMTGE